MVATRRQAVALWTAARMQRGGLPRRSGDSGAVVVDAYHGQIERGSSSMVAHASGERARRGVVGVPSRRHSGSKRSRIGGQVGEEVESLARRRAGAFEGVGRAQGCQRNIPLSPVAVGQGTQGEGHQRGTAVGDDVEVTHPGRLHQEGSVRGVQSVENKESQRHHAVDVVMVDRGHADSGGESLGAAQGQPHDPGREVGVKVRRRRCMGPVRQRVGGTRAWGAVDDDVALARQLVGRNVTEHRHG